MEESMSTITQTLYEKAKRIIPGGTQLLSKRPEQYAPELWPAYAKKAKDCRIWDLDGTEFIDMSSMGIGSCIAGYANDEINEKLIEALQLGSMCSLNFAEEVFLSDKLLQLHPWADMVRYARSGGEALAVAVRIARASTKKEKVVFCGYHGWSDWYLAGNLYEKNALGGHLLDGLNPLGLPKGLTGTAIPFHYNNLEEFDRALAQGDIAAVVMEPMRYQKPNPGFLEEIRKKTEAIGAVLIFDEVTSAWRQTVGGIHLKLKIEPDMCVFAKAISNGTPCAAIIGKEYIMQVAQDTFISSTYWTERLGFVAALATIDFLESHNVVEILHANGLHVQQIWKNGAAKNNINISIEGDPSLCHFSINHEHSQLLKTILTQQLLKFHILGNTAYYASCAHKQEDFQAYEEAFYCAMSVVADAIKSKNPESFLEGPVAHTGFSRLV